MGLSCAVLVLLLVPTLIMCLGAARRHVIAFKVRHSRFRRQHIYSRLRAAAFALHDFQTVELIDAIVKEGTP
jgi:hypothetical protein